MHGRKIGVILICFFSHGTSNSRGVCVLFKTSCNFDIKQIFQDSEGRFIILDIISNSQKTTLINVYGPNNDEPTFLENIQKELDDFECESIIWEEISIVFKILLWIRKEAEHKLMLILRNAFRI